jgi:choline-sulfatase
MAGMGKAPEALLREFPRGVPLAGGDRFLLEDAIDWIAEALVRAPQPFLGYFHFFPPHSPYNTSHEFYNRFKGDGYREIRKPANPLVLDNPTDLMKQRREYDEYLLYADREFRRFHDALRASGLLENTWLVVTSDHGEMFERGVVGHKTPLLHQPVIRVPLLIFEPGREAGMDIHAPTSAADVLPTLAHVTGHAIPGWSEGEILQPYAARPPASDRAIYCVQAPATTPQSPLRQASTVLVKGRYKLHYYFGFQTRGVDDMVNLYDTEADPEELVDLAATRRGITEQMLSELKLKLDEVNRPYL